jgi:nicotinamidase-related amidase
VAIRGLDKGERAALLINECQNGMVNPSVASNDGLAREATRRGIVSRIAMLAGACRELGVPVVHNTIVLRADHVGTTASCLLQGALVKTWMVVEGRQEAEIHPDLAPLPADVVVQRVHGLSPFHGTELEPVLRSLRVQTVIIAGVSTNMGVPGACLEAVNRGFTAVVPEDATAGAWQEAHEFQMRHTLPLLASVSTVDEIVNVLRSR